MEFATRMAKRTFSLESPGAIALTKLRKQVARLHELQRLLQRAALETTQDGSQLSISIRSLSKRVRLIDPARPMHSVQDMLAKAKKELFDMQKSQRTCRLQTWRQKMQTDIRFASRRIKNRNSFSGVSVKGPEGPLKSNKDAVKTLVLAGCPGH